MLAQRTIYFACLPGTAKLCSLQIGAHYLAPSKVEGAVACLCKCTELLLMTQGRMQRFTWGLLLVSTRIAVVFLNMEKDFLFSLVKKKRVVQLIREKLDENLGYKAHTKHGDDRPQIRGRHNQIMTPTESVISIIHHPRFAVVLPLEG